MKHSTSGFVFHYSQAAISWGSKKQTAIALSSCEAEIMAASEACKEGIYLDNLIDELKLGTGKPFELGTDNTGARALSYNPSFHDRVKHIERRHYFIRDMVEKHRVSVPYVNTADNMADFFTKPLKWDRFRLLRDRIMNVTAA